MTLFEMNSRLETVQVNEEQHWELHKLYVILNLEKDDFCKIVDTVGVEKLLEQSANFDMFIRAEFELKRKEDYIKSKKKIEELNIELIRHKSIVKKYESDLGIN